MWCAYPLTGNAEFKMWLNSLVAKHKKEIAANFADMRKRNAQRNLS